MPRRSRSSSNRTSSPSHTQTRQASTASMPPRQAAHPAQGSAPAQSSGPGMFGQMASIAGGVAVGSSVGHVIGSGISSLFGGSSEAPAQAPEQAAPSTYYSQPPQHAGASCANEAKNFTNCLESTNNDFTACQYYLDMLKQCQSFANTRM